MSEKTAITPRDGFQTHVFSNAIVYDRLVYVSGNIGMDYPTKKLAEGSIAARTKKALANIEYVLLEAGSSLRHVVKVVVYLTNMSDWDEMSAAYAEVMPTPRPARTCVAVAALPFGTDVCGFVLLSGYLLTKKDRD